MKMFSLEKFAERLLNLMVEHGDSTYSPACSPPRVSAGCRHKKGPTGCAVRSAQGPKRRYV
jgi:hypothetical protein